MNSTDQAGLPLEDLAEGLQQLMQRGADPYQALPDETSDPIVLAANPVVANPVDQQCEVTPVSILEALLFVGTPDHRPLTSLEISQLMNGVSAREIDGWVTDLNELYHQRQCPYTIASVDDGYRLELLPQYAGLRETMFGSTRQTKLSPAAIDVLSIVAYQQPVTAEQIEQLRGFASGAILSQLVRRQLLMIERDPTAPRTVKYRTTERFLQLFGISSLDELPQGLELER
jgi:segregation and condensation protein B